MFNVARSGDAGDAGLLTFTEDKGESLALKHGDEADGEYSSTAVMQCFHPMFLIRYSKYLRIHYDVLWGTCSCSRQ